MTQPEYLVRMDRKLIQTGDVRVTRVEKRRVTHRTVSGLGTIGHSEGTGQYETNLLRVALAGDDVRLADGRAASKNRQERIDRTAAGVKKAVRRIRPEEAAVIDEFDAQIAALEEQILALREMRKVAVSEAWSRAHVVRLKEIEDKIAGGF